MKKFNGLTEEEIIRDALRAVPEYLESIRASGVFRLEKCVEEETRRLEKLYRTGKGIRQYLPLSKKELADMEAFTAHFIPILTERTLAVQQRYMKQRRISEINAITARELISAGFRKAGLTAEVTGQRYRAKVVVSLPAGNLRFYVRYKDLGREGIMDDVVRAVLDLKDAVTRLGQGVMLSKY